MAKKPLGPKKGHIAGSQVTGGHTTVFDGADTILKKLASKNWFFSVQPMQVHADRSVGGGQPFVAIQRHQNPIHANTLTLTFKKAGIVQKVNLRVINLEENGESIIQDITDVVYKTWNAKTYNRIDETEEKPVQTSHPLSNERQALLERWGNNGRNGGRAR